MGESITKRVTLKPSLRRAVLRIIASEGEAAVLEATQLQDITLARALAGLRINRGTAAQIEQYLAAKR